ncbi:FtsW/RodA/SpoVE family cell cycle protein [Mammaliicoccus sp. Dog046]|uniref:FtsW/RodA/SpoVE family cell cycle protein n=1 Tax=Mammaliicoccus sp. Dog046 TaxID=3034233 RepID=UPI002B260347|nr:FtsW/RodA/SpoVE family cell cycle protein [Mammaliicoccus sp. Dog046]WQK84643.1 FtsW/RodA/SpoVE family cell cycle protein [Mammaliicoccus sp. Dog046]
MNFKKRFKFKKSSGGDIGILFTYFILAMIGVVMIYSASMVSANNGALTNGVPISDKYFIKRQFIYFCIGSLVVITMSYRVNINVFQRKEMQQVILTVVLALLVITLLFGSEINGSKNWLNLGIVNIQSSELLKISSILYLSYIIDRRLRAGSHFNLSSLVSPLLVLGFGIMLILIQGDLGGALLNSAIIAFMLLYSDIKNKIKIQIFSITALPMIIYLVYTLLFDAQNIYRMKRIKVVANPFLYENGDGYQLANALLAIGNGGFFGKGLGNGIMKLGYLPEPHTDFIFAVISEELGLVGVLVIIAMYAFITFKGVIYANKTSNHFYKMICIGISSYIFMQVFINLAGISGLIPLTGVTLPLLSYGGSSFLSISIALGILLATSRKINKELKQ